MEVCMQFYLKILWVVWMYTCTATMTLCLLIMLGTYVWNLLLPGAHADLDRAAQCIEQGSTWDADARSCRTAA